MTDPIFLHQNSTQRYPVCYICNLRTISEMKENLFFPTCGTNITPIERGKSQKPMSFVVKSVSDHREQSPVSYL